MVEKKTPKIYGISEDRNEYDRYKTLLDNSLKEVLDDKKVSEALKENNLEERGECTSHQTIVIQESNIHGKWRISEKYWT